jgi:alpha-glucosidase
MFDQMRFWLDRGVAGFRLDSIDTLLEDPELGDEGYRRDPKGEIMRDRTGTPLTTGERTSNLPEIHGIIRRMRAMLASYPGDRVLMGETYLPNVTELDKWYGGEAKDELQLPMDTQVGVRNTLNPETWRTRLDEAETQLHGSMPLLVYDNHDNPRLDRYCRESLGASKGADCGRIERMLETILLTSRDAALLYYGDEIAMATGNVPAEPNRRRDAERTPMQWNAGKNAGFSQADKTWLPVSPDYTTVNVDAEKASSDSMLEFHRKLIALRRTDPVLREGDQHLVPFPNAQIVAYLRTVNKGRRMVITNFSGEEQELDVGKFAGRRYQVLQSNFGEARSRGRFNATFKIPPYGAVLLKLEPGPDS